MSAAGEGGKDSAAVRHRMDGIPQCRELGLEVLEVARERCRVLLPYRADLVGNPETGVLAGGVITTVIDSVCGMAVQMALRKTVTIATLDLRIDYLRPSTPGSDLIAEAECYKLTRRIAFVRSMAHNGDAADPLAHCVATFMIGTPGQRAPQPGGDTHA